jgi:glutamine amidotransferase
MVRTAIIDYGIGNIRSIKRSLEAAGSKAIITRVKKDIFDVDALVLPGVGAFEGAIQKLEPLSKMILTQVQEKKPLLGICLGLQLLYTASSEGGYHQGLNVFKGNVVKLPPTVKTPHIGWNTLKIVQPNHPLLEEVPNNAYVYFVHSYYADVKSMQDVISQTHYGVDFPSIVSRGNTFATQFHPEKSGVIGLKIMKNFVKFVKS